MKEEIDIVDAHDNVVKQADSSVAHQEGLLHRMVHVMLFNPKGELFVKQRSLSKNRYPGFWEGSLSGHVKSGETPLQAAERELHGELGACITPKHFQKAIKFGLHKEDERVFVTLFIVKDFKEELKIDSDEIKTGGFMSLQKVESEIKDSKKFFHPVFRKAFEEFKALKINPKEFV